jgi:U3 small nucleolar ribonucleoprotein protein IMP4
MASFSQTNLAYSAKASGITDTLLLHEHRGRQNALTVSHLPHGLTASFSLHGVTLRCDIPQALRGTVSEVYPHMIFHGFSTALGKCVVTILKHLFPPHHEHGRKASGNRVMTFSNEDDMIHVWHHVYVRTGHDSVELAEVGLRISMRLFEIRGGTMDSNDGDVEWSLNQYTRTAHKKNHL